MLDLGDPWLGQVLVTSDGSTAADPTAITVTVTLPDGTTQSPTPTHLGTGSYQATYTPTLVGRHTVYWHATGVYESAVTDTFEVRPSASNMILSLAEARQALNFVKTINDEQLRDYIDSVTTLIENRIGPVLSHTFTETLYGGRQLYLSNTPVTAVTSITPALTGGWAVPASNITFNATTGVVQLINRWSFTDTYTVVYTAGRGLTPAIKQAARITLQHLWANQRGNAPARDGDSYTAPFSLPNAAREYLDPYMTPAVG